MISLIEGEKINVFDSYVDIYRNDINSVITFTTSLDLKTHEEIKLKAFNSVNRNIEQHDLNMIEWSYK